MRPGGIEEKAVTLLGGTVLYDCLHEREDFSDESLWSITGELFQGVFGGLAVLGSCRHYSQMD